MGIFPTLVDIAQIIKLFEIDIQKSFFNPSFMRSSLSGIYFTTG